MTAGDEDDQTTEKEQNVEGHGSLPDGAGAHRGRRSLGGNGTGIEAEAQTTTGGRPGILAAYQP